MPNELPDSLSRNVAIDGDSLVASTDYAPGLKFSAELYQGARRLEKIPFSNKPRMVFKTQLQTGRYKVVFSYKTTSSTKRLPYRVYLARVNDKTRVVNEDEYISIKVSQLTDNYKNSFNEIIKFLRPKEIRENKEAQKLKELNLVQDMPHEVGVFFRNAIGRSYRNIRCVNSALYSGSKFTPPKTLESKENAYRFVDLLGIIRPHAEYFAEASDIFHADLSVGKVVKPKYSNGGKCIHAITKVGNDSYKDWFSGTNPFSNQQLVSVLEEETERHKLQGGWIVEDMVTSSNGSPRETFDVKIYTFYGQAELILEIDRWGERKPIYYTYDTKGVAQDIGLYQLNHQRPMLCTDELINKATDISKTIPWPHVRVDFLVSDTQCIFGEFTFGPGSFTGFNRAWDRRLAGAYAKASSRLYDDMFIGKKFEEYEALLDQIKSP